MKSSPERKAYNHIRRIIDKDDTSLVIDYEIRMEEIRVIVEDMIVESEGV